jgi:hypothetical protein
MICPGMLGLNKDTMLDQGSISGGSGWDISLLKLICIKASYLLDVLYRFHPGVSFGEQISFLVNTNRVCFSIHV